MNVATWQESKSYVVERLSETTDSGEQNRREFFAPGTLEPLAVVSRDCEKEFVILPVGNCIVDLRAGGERQLLPVNLEPEFACLGQARQIGAETVAQIHHSVDAEVLGQPARFIDARHKAQMSSAQRSDQTAGHEQIIP